MESAASLMAIYKIKQKRDIIAAWPVFYIVPAMNVIAFINLFSSIQALYVNKTMRFQSFYKFFSI